MHNLLILGAGQHGHVVKEIAESMQCYKKIDFLDDYAECAIGKLSECENYKDDYQEFFVAFGDSSLRMQWVERLEMCGCGIATIVSNKALLSPSAEIGEGTVIEPGAIVNTASKISKGCILSIGALVDHDAVIGEGCHIESGAVVMPNQRVPSKTTVMENTVYKNR